MEENYQKNYYSRKSIWKWILLYVLIGAVAYVAVYYFLFYKKGGYIYNQQDNQNTQTADWKTYKNDEYGFAISYPSTWVIKSDNQQKAALVQFIAPNTGLLMESNRLACNDGNNTTECNTDGVPVDIILSISQNSMISITEPQGTVKFNNIVFTKYLGAFAGEQNFIATHNNQDFNFTCTNTIMCSQMLSTLKFTK